MKWLVISGVLLFVAGLVAIRYRRQLQMALYVFKMFKKMREMNKAGAQEEKEKRISPASAKNDIPLVRCAKCGAWKPQTDALKFGGNVFYCSSNCMEKAVQV